MTKSDMEEYVSAVERLLDAHQLPAPVAQENPTVVVVSVLAIVIGLFEHFFGGNRGRR